MGAGPGVQWVLDLPTSLLKLFRRGSDVQRETPSEDTRCSRRDHMATRTPTRTSTRRPERRPRHVVVERSAPRTAEQRCREEGGPRDLAFYDCACGHGFSGA